LTLWASLCCPLRQAKRSIYLGLYALERRCFAALRMTGCVEVACVTFSSNATLVLDAFFGWGRRFGRDAQDVVTGTDHQRVACD
jgi:hypothetical protein